MNTERVEKISTLKHRASECLYDLRNEARSIRYKLIDKATRNVRGRGTNEEGVLF